MVLNFMVLEEWVEGDRCMLNSALSSVKLAVASSTS